MISDANALNVSLYMRFKLANCQRLPHYVAQFKCECPLGSQQNQNVIDFLAKHLSATGNWSTANIFLVCGIWIVYLNETATNCDISVSFGKLRLEKIGEILIKLSEMVKTTASASWSCWVGDGDDDDDMIAEMPVNFFAVSN